MVTTTAEGRTRASRLRPQQRRAHLLDVAAELVLDTGFEALTMEGLAQRAGVSKGLGYAYFQNAEELALALYDREVGEVYRRIEEATTATASFETRVRHAVNVYLDTVAQRGALLATLQTKLSGKRRDRTLRQRLAGFIGFWAQHIAAEFSVPPAVAEVLAGATLSAADALARAWLAKRVTRREAEELCVGFVLGGLAAASTPARRRGSTPVAVESLPRPRKNER